MLSSCENSEQAVLSTGDYFKAYLKKDPSLVPVVPLQVKQCLAVERYNDLESAVPDKIIESVGGGLWLKTDRSFEIPEEGIAFKFEPLFMSESKKNIELLAKSKIYE